MYYRNEFLALLVVIAVVLILLTSKSSTRWWAAGALGGLAVGVAIGWMSAVAPKGKGIEGLWGPVGSL